MFKNNQKLTFNIGKSNYDGHILIEEWDGIECVYLVSILSDGYEIGYVDSTEEEILEGLNNIQIRNFHAEFHQTEIKQIKTPKSHGTLEIGDKNNDIRPKGRILN